jgi:hypothetical protein
MKRSLILVGSILSATVVLAGSTAAQPPLIVNGDFSLGNVGFDTDFTYSPGYMHPGGTYDVVDNPRNSHPTTSADFHDHTTGDGLMLAFNGSWTSDDVAWSQSISVSPHQCYEFSMYVASWNGGGPRGSLRVLVNGAPIAPDFDAPAIDGIWEFFSASFLSGENSTVVVSIVNTGTAEYGNDIALDDIQVRSRCDFARLKLETASLSFDFPGFDSFHFSGAFDLGENSDGIDPQAEDVTVSFGTYTEALPAGSFVCTGSDCVYDNEGSGITHAMISDGLLEFTARHVDLSGTSNPVEIHVQIGNDFGNAVARLSGELTRILTVCGLGVELALLLPPLMWLWSRGRRRTG